MEDKDFIKRLVCCIWFIVLEGVEFCFINVPLELVGTCWSMCFKHLTFVLCPTLVRNKPCYKFISLCIA